MDIQVRDLTVEDYKDLKRSMQKAYGQGGDIWSRENIVDLIDVFPEGQLCVEVDGKVVACALSLIIDSKKTNIYKKYYEIIDNGTFSTHDYDGDVLYGIEVFVHPDFRSLRLGRRLYDARKELCEKMNLRGIVAGGRIPNYHNYADKFTPRTYIEKVKRKEIYDPTLTFQLSNDFHVSKVLKNYLPGDTESNEFATLLEWDNIYYDPDAISSSTSKQTIRLGLVQWQMRLFKDIEDFYDQVEFFVDAVSDYGADFVMFPEFFNTPLMSPYNHLPERAAMEKLSELTAEIVEKLQEFAVSYNVNIVAGSMPIMEYKKLYNASYLCHRNGKLDVHKKSILLPMNSNTMVW